MKVPVIISPDFECFIVPISGAEPDSRKKHEPFSFSYKIKFSDEVGKVLIKISTGRKLLDQDLVTYRAKTEEENFALIFVEMLEEHIRKIHKEFDFERKR